MFSVFGHEWASHSSKISENLAFEISQGAYSAAIYSWGLKSIFFFVFSLNIFLTKKKQEKSDSKNRPIRSFYPINRGRTTHVHRSELNLNRCTWVVRPLFMGFNDRIGRFFDFLSNVFLAKFEDY